jgi:hypothetical protein
MDGNSRCARKFPIFPEVFYGIGTAPGRRCRRTSCRWCSGLMRMSSFTNNEGVCTAKPIGGAVAPPEGGRLRRDGPLSTAPASASRHHRSAVRSGTGRPVPSSVAGQPNCETDFAERLI